MYTLFVRYIKTTSDFCLVVFCVCAVNYFTYVLIVSKRLGTVLLVRRPTEFLQFKIEWSFRTRSSDERSFDIDDTISFPVTSSLLFPRPSRVSVGFFNHNYSPHASNFAEIVLAAYTLRTCRQASVSRFPRRSTRSKLYFVTSFAA